MRKFSILSLLILSSLGLLNCQTSTSSTNVTTASSTTNPSSTPSIPSIQTNSSTFNFVDKDKLEKLSPSELNNPSAMPLKCQNENILTGNVYTSKPSKSFYGYLGGYNMNSVSLENYLDILKTETPIEGVEVIYGDKKITTDKNGTFNIPNPKERIKLSFSKKGFYTFNTEIENSCLFHIGLSPLFENEIDANQVNFTTLDYNFSDNSYTKDYNYYKDTSLVYFLAKNKEQFSTLKNHISSKDFDEIEKKIDSKEKMVLLFSNISDNLGFPVSLIDSVMESKDNLIFSTHKGTNINVMTLKPYPQGPWGDTFRPNIQVLVLPYSDKKISFNIYYRGKIESFDLL